MTCRLAARKDGPLKGQLKPKRKIMEPFQTTMTLPALIILVIGTMGIFVWVIMMAKDLYPVEEKPAQKIPNVKNLFLYLIYQVRGRYDKARHYYKLYCKWCKVWNNTLNQKLLNQ
jgi:hypothetical protein